jgi:hypothetical protein
MFWLLLFWSWFWVICDLPPISTLDNRELTVLWMLVKCMYFMVLWLILVSFSGRVRNLTWTVMSVVAVKCHRIMAHSQYWHLKNTTWKGQYFCQFAVLVLGLWLSLHHPFHICIEWTLSHWNPKCQGMDLENVCVPIKYTFVLFPYSFFFIWS